MRTMTGAFAETQFSAVEHAIDEIALALDTVIHEFGALWRDHEERWHFRGDDVGWKIDPRAPSVIERRALASSGVAPARDADAIGRVDGPSAVDFGGASIGTSRRSRRNTCCPPWPAPRSCRSADR